MSMNTMTFKTAKENLEKSIQDFENALPEIRSDREYKKQEIDRFYFTEGNNVHIRTNFPDFERFDSIGNKLLLLNIAIYRKESQARKKKNPNFIRKFGHQTIADFELEIYP